MRTPNLRLTVFLLVMGSHLVAFGQAPSARPGSPNPLIAALQPPEAGIRLDAEGRPLAPGMVQRLGSTRFKVPGWWRRLTFAGNDEWIWIKADERLSVIHRESGRTVNQQQLRLGEWNVWSVTASPDGMSIAVGMSEHFVESKPQWDYRVVIMSARTTAHLQEFTWNAPPSELGGLSFSGDGRVLLAATESGEVRLWNVATGELLRHEVLADVRPRHAALSPDGGLSAFSNSSRASMWRIGKEPVQLPTKGGGAVCFALNGGLFATIADDGARLWNPATGELVALLAAGEPRAYSAADFGIAFTPDSRVLAVPAHRLGRIDLWDVESKERIATLPVHRPRGLAISRDGRWLAASGAEDFTTIFDLTTQKRVNSPCDGHAVSLFAVRFAGPDTLVTSSVGDARVWNIATGKQQHVLAHENTSMVRSLTTSPDRSLIATSSFDDTLGVWEDTTGKRLFTLKGHGRVGGMRSLQFSPDGSRVVSWGDDGVLRQWNTTDGSLAMAETLDLPGYDAEVKARGLSEIHSAAAPDARALFVLFDAQLFEFEVATGKRLRQVAVERGAAPLAVSPDGQWIATGQARRAAEGSMATFHVVLRDRKTLEIVREWPVIDPRASQEPRTFSIAEADTGLVFSPDSKLLAWSRVGGRSGIDVFDIEQNRLVASIPVESWCGCLDFSPDGSLIASGHADSTASIWNIRDPGFVVGPAAGK